MQATYAFIGAGNMGRALIGGLLAAGQDRSGIRVADPGAAARSACLTAFGLEARDDPAAIVDLGSDLLAYSGYPEAEEVETQIDLGDEARIYEVNSLVLGQVEPGTAVVWRPGPVVSLVAVGGITGDTSTAA